MTLLANERIEDTSLAHVPEQLPEETLAAAAVLGEQAVMKDFDLVFDSTSQEGQDEKVTEHPFNSSI